MDVIVPKQTINALDPTETLDDKSSHEFDENIRETPNQISSKESSFKIGKKRLHPVEERHLRSLKSYEKRVTKRFTEDDNHYFALSLVPSLASLPRQLNIKCRTQIMETISKYITMAEQRIAHLPAHQRPYCIQSTPSPYSKEEYGIVHPARSPVESVSSASSYITNLSNDSHLSNF